MRGEYLNHVWREEHSGGVDSELLIRIRDTLISHLHLLNPVDISDILT